MILSDREIKLGLRRDHVRLTPQPSDNAVSSTSIDLTLHEEITCWQPRQEETDPLIVAYPARPDFDVIQFMSQHATRILIPAQGFLLKPSAFVLGWTAEAIRLPYTSRLAARVEGRSSLARLGVGVHVTAPTIHSGFGSVDDPQHVGTRIRLEIWNCGPLHVCLEKGMNICQLILEEVHGTPDKGYQGVFATQAPEAVPPASTTSERTPRKRRRH